MSTPEGQPDKPQNPQFTVMNRVMGSLVTALELAADMQEYAQEMHDKAHLDPLTGVANRYAFDDSFDGLLQQVDGEGHRISDDGVEDEGLHTHSLLLLDLDHFKKINDTRGHVAGDDVLKDTARTLETNTRRRDVVARIGGEEFAVLLPRANSEQAAIIGEKFRALIEGNGDATVSVGVVAIDLGASRKENIRRADKALYHAKEHGRNQVVRYEDLPEDERAGITPRGPSET